MNPNAVVAASLSRGCLSVPKMADAGVEPRASKTKYCALKQVTADKDN